MNTLWTSIYEGVAGAISVIMNGLGGLLSSFLPTTNGFSVDFQNALSQLMGFGAQLGFVVPWNTIFTILFITSTFELGLFTFKIIAWLLKLARG
jgi:hypothetical protein